MKKLLAALLLSTALGASAEAQTWSGPYAGIGFGGVFDNHNVSPISGFGTNGWSGTLFLGYDYSPAKVNAPITNSPLVFGIWANGDLDAAKGTIGSVAIERQGDWAIGGRAGFLISPNFLAYGTVGYTNASYSTNVTGAKLGTLDGITFGGGIETPLMNSLFMRVEYRHDDYNPADFEKFTHSTLKDTISDNQVQLVFAFKLNGANTPLSTKDSAPVYTPLK